mmetsp:Transcript_7131/g.8027  ORF Transcript_7131/g.8027 Transcript_7131/m.8027 type:complete len:96 (+) Transcript_7131:27-314(+)|eukprot:CAMPEP_0205821708 /NCGR_PEP_ID=MMETSP0206-20130828/9021_1 /ASSEMBLY_ACC=CAM_ASM_000279 /TAXON_ID=36767 /ORGANISM="Euplotes focardii, Strain TN1" /LENGTH=95 /DNA_ID=CAMNT_0053117387 /DNA_START=27 /DNA_END=314 /DNA_ORIENTATION=-
MPKAVWKGKVIAEVEEGKCQKVEGNVYFPPESLNRQYFKESAKTSGCPWKGLANYYTVSVDGEDNANAAWYYANPKPAAANIKGHVAFWKGVQVS